MGKVISIGAKRYIRPAFKKKIRKTQIIIVLIRYELLVNLMIWVSSMKPLRAKND